MAAWRAGRDHSVVAGVTSPRYDGGVVKACGTPRIRGVAKLAVVAARDVTGGLGCCRRTIVTTEAVVCDSRMIESAGGAPAPRRMAKFAIVAGLDMSRMFWRGDAAVVTAETI